MKIEEPKTPYSYDVTDDRAAPVDPALLAQRIQMGSQQQPKVLAQPSPPQDQLTDEERERRKNFEKKRKMHYNEFEAVRMAREMKDEDEDEDD